MKSRYCYAHVPKIKTRWVGPLVRLRRWLRRREPDMFEVGNYYAPIYPSKKV